MHLEQRHLDILTDQGGNFTDSPGSQTTGLEVVSSEKTVLFRLQAPDVESVGHAGAGLVGLGHQNVVLGREYQVLRFVYQVADLIDLGLRPPGEHFDGVDSQVGPGPRSEDGDEAVAGHLDADNLLSLVSLTEILTVPDCQRFELVALLPEPIKTPGELFEFGFVKFLLRLLKIKVDQVLQVGMF